MRAGGEAARCFVAGAVTASKSMDLGFVGLDCLFNETTLTWLSVFERETETSSETAGDQAQHTSRLADGRWRPRPEVGLPCACAPGPARCCPGRELCWGLSSRPGAGCCLPGQGCKAGSVRGVRLARKDGEFKLLSVCVADTLCQGLGGQKEERPQFCPLTPGDGGGGSCQRRRPAPFTSGPSLCIRFHRLRTACSNARVLFPQTHLVLT